MSRNYQNPPLVEALCEFQFASDAWDWTIPGLIYQKISTDFPKKRQLKKMELELRTEPGQLSQRFMGDVERMQFLKEDETALVQVGPNLLAVNSLQPYLHWSSFRPLIMDMFKIYQGIANPTGLRRIGLRYINRIEIPDPSMRLLDYFNLRPQVPEDIPALFKSLFMRMEIPHEGNNGILILTFGTGSEPPPTSSAFILDLDFASFPETETGFTTCEQWIEEAHTHIEIAFEACITENLRALFQEVKV